MATRMKTVFRVTLQLCEVTLPVLHGQDCHLVLMMAVYLYYTVSRLNAISWLPKLNLGTERGYEKNLLTGTKTTVTKVTYAENLTSALAIKNNQSSYSKHIILVFA